MRSRKPDKVTLERIYRKVLALQKELDERFLAIEHTVDHRCDVIIERMEKIEKSMQLSRLHTDTAMIELECKFKDLAPIVKHCERLLREKEHLRAMIYPGELELRQANQFMAEPPVLRDVYNSDFDELI